MDAYGAGEASIAGSVTSCRMLPNGLPSTEWKRRWDKLSLVCIGHAAIKHSAAADVLILMLRKERQMPLELPASMQGVKNERSVCVPEETVLYRRVGGFRSVLVPSWSHHTSQ